SSVSSSGSPTQSAVRRASARAVGAGARQRRGRIPPPALLETYGLAVRVRSQTRVDGLQRVGSGGPPPHGRPPPPRPPGERAARGPNVKPAVIPRAAHSPTQYGHVSSWPAASAGPDDRRACSSTSPGAPARSYSVNGARRTDVTRSLVTTRDSRCAATAASTM